MMPHTLQLKKEKATDYVLSWKSNGLYASKFCNKNYFLGVTSILKKCEKQKYLYKGHGIPFDGKGEWRFDNGTARNVTIFGIDNNNLILSIVRLF